MNEAGFRRRLGAAVLLAALVRAVCLLMDPRGYIGGDGSLYHIEALRLADGLGYTSGYGDVGAPMAHHPPAWLTILAVASWLGAPSLLAHQLIAMSIGLGVVVLTGLVGRRYADERTGILAAWIAAIYPGFWILELQVLSEPLALLLLGCFLLAVASLHERPTLKRCVVVGAVGGVLALARSEQLALFAVVVAPVLLFSTSARLARRALWFTVSVAVCGAMLAPWAAYNLTRFEKPVLLSTNGGGTMLSGNCPPTTYVGERIGHYDSGCAFRMAQKNLDLDRSQRDRIFLKAAERNIRLNLDKLPQVVAARLGRMLAVFRPSQTVSFAADWMQISHGPVWAWIVSYWILLACAVAGIFVEYRRGRFVLPLIAPLLVACAVVSIAFGEPRYHSVADLGVIVLAAGAIDSAMRRFTRARVSAAGA